jgi:hypothetical protein
MQRSGPVQGMSGSPIYLWEEGEDGTVGEGGRLIGAFAFGFSDVNVCLVGVQPIEYMREVGQRAVDRPKVDDEARRRSIPGSTGRVLAALRQSADAAGVPAAQRMTLEAVSRLVSGWPSEYARPGGVSTAAGPGRAGQVLAMKLPLTVGDPETAGLLGPLLAPAGIEVMAGDLTAVAGKPPSNVDPDRVKLEPGSVLSIPLAYGDLDLNAAGTVTDVLPDGTVLGFGHAMNAVGASRLPMANGYTHFVVSRDSISFKRGSSLDIVGSIVRDEAAAVAGLGRTDFFAAPVNVTIAMAGQPERNYAYRVVDDPQMTPAVLAAVINGSLTAVQGPPMLHTIHLTGTIRFTGGREVQFDRAMPMGGMQGLVFETLPAVNALMQNPYDPLRVESADLRVAVEPTVEMSSLLAASLSRPIVQPGDDLTIHVTLQPFDGPTRTMALPFTVPGDMPEGEHQLVVGDYSSYTLRRLTSQPRFALIKSVDQLAAALQEIASVPEHHVFVGLQRPEPGLAVGRRAMEELPGSRLTVLGSSASSTLVPYPRFVEASYPTPQVVQGELGLTLRVQRDAP